MNGIYQAFLATPLVALPAVGLWSMYVAPNRFLRFAALSAWTASLVIALVTWSRSHRWTRNRTLAAIVLYPFTLSAGAWLIAVLLGVSFPGGIWGLDQRGLAFSAMMGFVPAAIYSVVFYAIAIVFQSRGRR